MLCALPAAEQAEFERLVRAPGNGEMRKIVTQREWRGERKVLLEQLRFKFGEVEEEVEEQINAIDDEKEWTALARDLLTAESLADLGLGDGRAAARALTTD